jgi:multidrug efflux pump subunit AcrB
MVRSALALTVSTGLALSTSACLPELVSDFGFDGSARVLVAFPAREAEVVPAALTALERTLLEVPGLQRVRSVGCAGGGAVLVHLAGDDGLAAGGLDPAAVVHGTIAAAKLALPAGSGPATVRSLHDDLALLTVHGDDIFAARAWVDETLVPAVKAVGGVYDVAVMGGRTELQLRVDPERLIAADVSVAEVLAAAKAASDLDKAEVKRLPGDVTISLRDVARLEEAPAGEKLRKDGGIEVRVRGHRAARASVRRVLKDLAPPAGTRFALLDGHSVETVTLLVARRGRGGAAEANDVASAADAAVDAAFADVAAAALSVPGIHTFRRERRLQLTLDRERLTARGFTAAEAAAAADVATAATTGLMVKSVRGPLRVVLGAVSTPEALMRTRVLTTRDGQAVRLFDVTRATLAEEQRRERLELHDARRLRLSFDAGVRQRALPQLEARLEAIRAARPGVQIVVERDGDTAPLDVICP